MSKETISEDLIYSAFAAAESGPGLEATAESFVDVEEYENDTMYPEFARLAAKANYPEISALFLKVAGEEKLHAKWMRALYAKIGTPKEGADTARAKKALATIKERTVTSW